MMRKMIMSLRKKQSAIKKLKEIMDLIIMKL